MCFSVKGQAQCTHKYILYKTIMLDRTSSFLSNSLQQTLTLDPEIYRKWSSYFNLSRFSRRSEVGRFENGAVGR